MPITDPPPLTASPPTPSLAAPSTFEPRMDSWIAWTATHAAELVAALAWIRDTALAVLGYANAASGSAAAAAQSVIDAAAAGAAQVTLAADQVALATTQATASATSAAASAAAANFSGDWSALAGALAMPATVLHGGAFWVLLTDIPDVTASEPGISADWARSGESAAKAYFLGSM